MKRGFRATAFSLLPQLIIRKSGPKKAQVGLQFGGAWSLPYWSYCAVSGRTSKICLAARKARCIRCTGRPQVISTALA